MSTAFQEGRWILRSLVSQEERGVGADVRGGGSAGLPPRPPPLGDGGSGELYRFVGGYHDPSREWGDIMIPHTVCFTVCHSTLVGMPVRSPAERFGFPQEKVCLTVCHSTLVGMPVRSPARRFRILQEKLCLRRVTPHWWNTSTNPSSAIREPLGEGLFVRGISCSLT